MSLIKQHLYNIMTTTTTNLTPFESYISEMFEVDELSKIEMIAMELQAYGVESLEQFNDSYSGCFPSVDAFCEDLIDSCYNLDDLPMFIQTAIDYEMVWHQSMQYDYFTIYHNYEYYFFNRNF